MHVDVAVDRDSRGMALVASNHGGKLILLQSALVYSMSPEEAEIKTLVWATYIASSKAWGSVEWRCNAQTNC